VKLPKLLLISWCALWTACASGAPKKVVLIAGVLDDHAPGTHEYENNVLVLKHGLESSRELGDLKVEVHFDGWPAQAATLETADTIVLTSGGSDRKETDHPLYVGDRFAQLERQMKRGCGLVMIHWSVFHPARHHEKITEWLGGYFDYETGTNGPTQKWFSKIQHATWPAIPGRPEHPLLRGIKPFDLKDEFYFNIRFRDEDPRFTPILFKEKPGRENIVAWAVERADGGRGFGFTCGHFYTNWWQPEFRKLVLNATAWTAKIDVPSNGVASSLENYQSPPSRKEKAAGPVPGKLKPATVPRDNGATSKEEAWKDNRWNQMDIGRFLASSLSVANGRVAKGLSIRLGEQDEASVVYDTALCNMRAAWAGGFLAFDPTRFGLINTPRAAGEVQFVSPATEGWDGKPHYRGAFLHGKRVVLSYELNGTSVFESPWFESHQGTRIFTRTFQMGRHSAAQYLSLVTLKGGSAETNEIGGLQIVGLGKDGQQVAVAVLGSANGKLSVQNERIRLELPARDQSSMCKVFIWAGATADLDPFAEAIKKSPGLQNLPALTNGGPTRWGKAITVRGEIAPVANEPYVVDTLTVPYENEYHALMFLSGVDFFANGDAAVCSIHGDVWVVRGIDDTLQKLHWKRFATGLFQPLGLKIVNDKIHVLGRDQITVLHDRNGDGEADFYENFCNEIKTSLGGHDYATSLETDARGNFYYVDPFGVHRVSSDGKVHETIATGFRNPNGMGVSPEGILTVAPQEGNWTPSSAICEIKPGGFYGFGGPQVSSERPFGYDAPLCWIPRNIDNSTGSQLWASSSAWGTLQNQMLNLSFGRCSMMLVLREVVEGVSQGGVVPLKPRFLSGAMRGAFRKQDGQLYVVGALGWSTSATRDGCFQRVRYTGRKACLPMALHVHSNGIELKFSEAIDRETAEDTGSYGIEQWNYLYAAEYGSKEYSVNLPKEVGHDGIDIKSAKLLPDGRSIFLEIPDLKPVMQMQIQYNLNGADGKQIRGEIYNTINRVGTAKKPI
jgi:type 1 glutamine amidotransferase